MAMCSGCTPTDPWDRIGSEFVRADKVDAMGEHAITILGDSISHGANAEDIANDSWVALFKKAINAKTGSDNYGYTSTEGTLWNANGTYTELHAFPKSNNGFKDRGDKGVGWTEYRSAELLGTKGLGSSKKGDWLQFEPSTLYPYFRVYYEAGSKYGRFTVGGGDGETIADVNGETVVDCHADERSYARTALYDSSLLGDSVIRITADSDEQVLITGIAYYSHPDGVVVNNYSNSGLQFAGTGKAQNGNMTGLDDSIVDFAVTSGTLIFALGYNDSHYFDDYKLFSQKIDHLIEVANANGTSVIVNDLCWDFDEGDDKYHDRYQFLTDIRDELRRLAEETNGLYVSAQEIYGQELLDTIADGAHPSAEGHRMIAQALLDAVGVPMAEDA
ncbi:MAG: SGNH/GDSL hydrolase family protein [Clostridia bacterium]|nr:SGNH/GDSL hydrolase family protein [Clostridia bacterium]